MWANIVKKSDSEEVPTKEELFDDDDFSSSEDEEEVEHRLKIKNKKTLDANLEEEEEDTTGGWRPETKKEKAVPQILKRFKLKKLKSANSQIYYLDNTYYYIWEYLEKEDKLVKPVDSICDNLRSLNGVVFKPFMVQPDEFW